MKLIAPPTLAAASIAGLGTGKAVTLAKGAAVAMRNNKKQKPCSHLPRRYFFLCIAGVGVTVVAIRRSHPNLISASPTIPSVTLQYPDYPGGQIIGVVIGPDGKPLSGAEIYIANEQTQVNVYGRSRYAPDTVTDLSGKYELTRPEGCYILVVRSPAGYAQISDDALKSQTSIKLAAWGRVEGIATDSGKPVPGAAVLLYRIPGAKDPLRLIVNHQTSVVADAQGHYVFPQVAPGEAWVQNADLHKTLRANVGWHYVQIQPGMTSQIAVNDGMSGHNTRN